MSYKPFKALGFILLCLYLLIGLQFLHQYHEVTYISGLSILYALYLIKKLFDALGQSLPFKELILSIMGLQMLIAPYLEYYYFHNEIFGVMKVDEFVYFSYALPATIAIHLGLNIFYPQNTHEIELFRYLKLKRTKNTALGIGLIIAGYSFYILSGIIPNVLSFVVVSLGFMRFIGFFYIWISDSRWSGLAFIIVFIPFILSTIRATIFIDLIVFAILITSIYVMKYNVPKWKIIIISIFSLFSIFLLQSVKYSYRSVVWATDFQGNSTSVLGNMMLEQLLNISDLDFKTIGANVNVRVNQGWILTGILDHIPAQQPIVEGKYVKREVLGLFLPRFLYPKKPVVGDRNKFEELVGWKLGRGTAMNVGVLGDGYGNFGRIGGIFFCLSFGAFMGYIFRLFYSLAKKYPTLPIWGTLIFFYSMRAGNEFYIIGNWIIKTGSLVFVYYFLIERNNRITKYFNLTIA